MARPLKNGLSYFPLDVDFFEDDKLRYVEAKYGTEGLLIAIRLLCKIYKQGCHLHWDEDAEVLFAKTVGASITPKLVKAVVAELVKRSFFDKDIFETMSMLTSLEIQNVYTTACNNGK